MVVTGIVVVLIMVTKWASTSVIVVTTSSATRPSSSSSTSRATTSVRGVLKSIRVISLRNHDYNRVVVTIKSIHGVKNEILHGNSSDLNTITLDFIDATVVLLRCHLHERQAGSLQSMAKPLLPKPDDPIVVEEEDEEDDDILLRVSLSLRSDTKKENTSQRQAKAAPSSHKLRQPSTTFAHSHHQQPPSTTFGSHRQPPSKHLIPAFLDKQHEGIEDDMDYRALENGFVAVTPISLSPHTDTDIQMATSDWISVVLPNEQ
ncbi:5'-nucleotidase surE [Senna tora]|uniref:5'-nucleotidase surE n=1 Tax=Senna tora TaxID=362788 RepID=A0A834TJ14_9FABA|nr:5'-nucleotidase surE [Senna tora]